MVDCLPASKLGLGIVRRDDRRRRARPLGAGASARGLGPASTAAMCSRLAGELLVRRRRRSAAGAWRDDDDRLERPARPAEPEAEHSMIRNGPRMRLKMAPGRRMVSTSSLPTNARRRSGSSGATHQRHAPSAGVGRLGRCSRPPRHVVGSLRSRPSVPLHEDREHLVERRPDLAGRRRPRRRSPDGLDDVRQRRSPRPRPSPGACRCRRSRRRGRSAVPRAAPGRMARRARSRSRRRRAAWRRSSSGSRGRRAGHRRSSATWSQSSASLTYCVVTRSVRPASRRRCSSSQIVWRRSGSMPAVGSSRKRSVRLVDERAGELEAALHAARQVAGPPAPGVPQLDQLEDLAGSAVAACARAARTATPRSRRSPGPSGPG